MKTLGDLFGSFAECADLSDAILSGAVTKVNILNEVRVVTLWVDFSSLIERDRLFEAEKHFSKALDASVAIKPHFGADLFTADYFPQLYAAVKREMPSINGTLNNAEVKLDGDSLFINLNNGGKALLDAKGFDKSLTRLIAEEFDLELKIKYTGTFEVDDNNIEYKQALQNVQTRMQREKLQKAVDFYREDEKISEDVRSRQAEEAVTEIEIREGSFATPQILSSSVRPLFGRSIRGKMVPLQTLYDGMRGVVVWGDIVEIERRTTKNSKNSITTIDITDYTGSMTVKA